MKNPVAPSTTLTLDGTSYTLLFDLESVAVAEDITDRPLLTGLRQKDINTPTISLVRAMLYACIHYNHPQVSFADVKKFVTRGNLPEVWGAVLIAWAAGVAERDPEDAENPQVD